MSWTWISPDACSRGRSICVTSPVTTTFEPKPSRVRNICICSGLVFCASSRMMNESFSVRPRMNASGATSIVPFSMYDVSRSGVEHVVERVEQRPQVRVDLGEHVAGQEAEPLAGLDRGAREDDPPDLAVGERRDGERHREVRLAGAGGADREGDRVLADRVDVALLVDRLRRDLLAAVAPDDVVEDLAEVLGLVERGEHRVDRARADLVAALDELDELVDTARASRHVGLVALDASAGCRAGGSCSGAARGARRARRRRRRRARPRRRSEHRENFLHSVSV